MLHPTTMSSYLLLALALLCSLSTLSSALPHSAAPRDCATATVDVSPLRALNDVYVHHDGATLWLHPCGAAEYCDCPVDSLLCSINKTSDHVSTLVNYSPTHTTFTLSTDNTTDPLTSAYSVSDGVPCASDSSVNRTLTVWFECAAGLAVAENVTRVLADYALCQYDVWIDSPYACANQSQTSTTAVLERLQRSTQQSSLQPVTASN